MPTRFATLVLVLTAAVLLGIGALTYRPLLWGALLLLPLVALGVWDVFQTQHSLLRNYPLLAHIRWFFEFIRPEIRQYLIESDREEIPFSREQRSVVYARAKDEMDQRPFGTRNDVYDAGYAWLNHSAVPRPAGDSDYRVEIGGATCARPYRASILNISAMSFGSLSANAILALNKGAKLGNFAHDTGEGGVSPHHLRHGGDLIWEIGSGYFGCRAAAGGFDPGRFAEQAACAPVRMIEIKLSQGAKPGHGGVLPAAKITAEIAATRGIPMGRDCVSPAWHSAFSTPLEMMRFIARLRELSGGKPVGFKLCVGHRWEFMAIVKAMRETEILPDFIVVDGKEGGTGAAPLEFVNHVGTPLLEGVTFAHNALAGAGLRERIRLGASGKVITAFHIVRALALGADWCNAARGFMFALGCVQAQVCHTNKCPSGVATQNRWRQRAIHVDDKAARVRNFHRNTLEALAEVVGAAGVDHPAQLLPLHLHFRQKTGEVLTAEQAFPSLDHGALLDGAAPEDYLKPWRMAQAGSFRPAGG